MKKSVVKIDSLRWGDFFELHCKENGMDFCYCTAWWVPTWEEFQKRRPEENKKQRDELFASGENDGYLLYIDDKVAGWCQAGPRDRLEKLTRQYDLAADQGSWAVTCFFIKAEFRRQGLASYMLKEVLSGLKKLGAKRVEAFPKRGQPFDEMEEWTGPEEMYLGAGFKVVRNHPKRPVLAIEF